MHLSSVIPEYGVRPNGDEIIAVSAASVVSLTIPTNSVAAEIAYAPVDLWVRYGDNVPDVNAGAYYPEGSAVLFDSYEKASSAKIKVAAQCSLHIQYYK